VPQGRAVMGRLVHWHSRLHSMQQLIVMVTLP
jgi:hypothetical protein